MKKTLLIGGILLIILLAGGAWAYLFIFGTPENTPAFFANFGGDEVVTTVVDEMPSIVDTGEVSQDGTPQSLRQLTLRPVAGATFIDGGIRYVEQGTGHIYDIALSTGNETQITNTTIPRVVSATFSPHGSRVALNAEVSTGMNTTLGSITKDDSGQGVVITKDLGPVRDLQFSNNGDSLTYLSPTSDGSTVYEYSIATDVKKTRTTIPLRQVDIFLHGSSLYLTTAPSAYVAGNAYKISGSSLQPQYTNENGFMAFSYEDGIVTTRSTATGLESIAYEGDDVYQIALGLMPEKCTPIAGREALLMCAAPLVYPNGIFPDDWYKGVVTLSDALWIIDIHNEEATLLADTESQTGRVVDVQTIVGSEDGMKYLLINKTDNTLWLFDAELASNG